LFLSTACVFGFAKQFDKLTGVKIPWRELLFVFLTLFPAPGAAATHQGLAERSIQVAVHTNANTSTSMVTVDTVASWAQLVTASAAPSANITLSPAFKDADKDGRFFTGDGSNGKTSLELHGITLKNGNADHTVEVGNTADFANTAYNSSSNPEVCSLHSSSASCRHDGCNVKASSERILSMNCKTGHPATDHSTHSAFSTSTMYPNSASETPWRKAFANSSAGSDIMSDMAGSNYSACSGSLLPAQVLSSSFGLPFSSLMLGVFAALSADPSPPSQAHVAACEQKLELQATEMRQKFRDELAAKDTIIWDLANITEVLCQHEVHRDSSICTAKNSVMQNELLYHVPILVSSQYNDDLHNEFPSTERPLDEILLHESPKDFISHDKSIKKQLNTTQKEQEGKRTNLGDSHDIFSASEPNPTLYNPTILARMGTGPPYDVLLQEPPGHDHSTSFNSRNPILPTKQMTRLYGNAADVMERAGHLPATEILRLADPDLPKHELLHQKIGRALRDVSNSKERAGHPDEILLQADDGGADDGGDGGGVGDGGGDIAGGGGAGGDGGGDEDVLPSAIDAPSVTVLPSIMDASSPPTKMWVANTIAVLGMHRRLTAVSSWEAMKTACGSSGTVTLSNDFVMGTYTPTPSPLDGGIDFSSKQLVIIGNNKTLDANQTG
jgi:hypothetical protein